MIEPLIGCLGFIAMAISAEISHKLAAENRAVHAFIHTGKKSKVRDTPDIPVFFVIRPDIRFYFPVVWPDTR
jgi:hypothetical protein